MITPYRQGYIEPPRASNNGRRFDQRTYGQPETQDRQASAKAGENTPTRKGAGTDKAEKKPTSANPHGLTEAEQQQVRELQQRDAEVRAHEAAHLAAAGGLATSGANYQYQTGPDGRSYAVGGDVSIDTSKGNTPEETIAKAQAIRAAAMAPSDPSPQDQRVAARAAAMLAEAQRELNMPAERDPEAVGKRVDKVEKIFGQGTESDLPEAGSLLQAAA